MNDILLANILNLVLSFSCLSPSFIDLLLLALLVSSVQGMVVKTPFSQVAVSLASMLGLLLSRGAASARLTAAAQAALVTMIDVKSAGWFLPFTLRTDVKLHNAPSCFELSQRKRAKPQKIPELFHNSEVLNELDSFWVIDINDSRLPPMGRIDTFDRIANPIYSHRFTRNRFLLQLLRCKCFIFANKSKSLSRNL